MAIKPTQITGLEQILTDHLYIMLTEARTTFGLKTPHIRRILESIRLRVVLDPLNLQNEETSPKSCISDRDGDLDSKIWRKSPQTERKNREIFDHFEEIPPLKSCK